LFCIYLCQNIKKPTELIQVGFTILFIKKTGLFFNFNLALPPETFTLVEFVPFLVLTSTPSVLRYLCSIEAAHEKTHKDTALSR
jgi:hypothetical protein